MATARSRLIDLSVARWYHCINRCVRRAFLLCEGLSDRRQWIERRLEELSQIFAVAVGGFTIVDNHLPVFLRVNTGRLFREGKATISAELAGILERLGCRSGLWADRMEKLRERRWLGRFFAASRAKLRDLARKLGVRHPVNLAGCPT